MGRQIKPQRVSAEQVFADFDLNDYTRSHLSHAKNNVYEWGKIKCSLPLDTNLAIYKTTQP